MPWYAHAATTFDPETGLFSEDLKGLATNPASMAAGDAGAPRINSIAAMDHQGASGAIGTYVFAICSATSVSFGSTVAGSTLNPTSATRSFEAVGSGTVSTFAAGSALTGTWRCMGTYSEFTGTSYKLGGATLWLRIA